MNISLKPLIGKLNDTCRTALEEAAGLCLTREHYDVDIEHLFLKLNEVPNTDFACLLRHFEVDPARLSRDLTRALDRLKTGNARTPALSPRIPRLISDAWLYASIEFSATRIRSGHLLLALLANEDLARLARESSAEWSKIPIEALPKELPAIVSGSAEAAADETTRSGTTRSGTAGDSRPETARVFISYRRNDSDGWAGRLYDWLKPRFDTGNLFMDINTIEPGIDFVEAIQKNVESCDILIALIGRHWLDSTNDAGRRRLDDPEDYVRLEIAMALGRRNIPVIPVLLEDVSIPNPRDLPDDLKQLARRNAFRISQKYFSRDMDELLAVLAKELRRAKTTKAPEPKKL